MYQSLSEFKDLMGMVCGCVHSLGCEKVETLVDDFFRADECVKVDKELPWCQEGGIDHSRLSEH